MHNRFITRIFPILIWLLGASGLSAQALSTGSATLSGQQEALPVATAASGFVEAEVELLSTSVVRLTISGSFSNLSSPVDTDINGGAHVHIAYAGQNGPISLPLTPSLSVDSLSGAFNPLLNTFDLDLLDFIAVDLGQLYVNIHTRNNPGGELRGVIVQEGSEAYYTNLLGNNEVPSIITEASGALLLEFQPEDSTLIVTGSFQNLSDTLATQIAGGVHLHSGLPGQNGPIVIELDPTLDEDRRGGVFTSVNNTFTLDAEQVTALRNGAWYANLHSGAFLSGEIRGQVLPPADVVFRAHLAGANEWPVVTTGASGQVLAHLAGDTLRVTGSFSGLTAPVATEIVGGAHLHTGMAGENGGVIIPLGLELAEDSLSGTFSLAMNEYALSGENRNALLNRGIYLNIHSDAHNRGEIRGQLLPESQAIFTAFLNGNQQIPSVTTTGRGMVKVEMRGDQMTATGSFVNLESGLNTDIAGGAHLHAGYPGQSGPVIFPLTTADVAAGLSGRFLPSTNTFSVTEGIRDTLISRFFYVNVHSLQEPGGEIRGSVLAEAESYFLAPLSGASEPQGVATDATGMVAAELRDTSAVLIGSFTGLESDFAFDVAGGMHLHQAIAGSNGGIAELINTEVDNDARSGVILADSNRIELSREQLSAMLDREIYVNLHTIDNQSGEIRGQVLPLALSYFHTSFSGVNAATYVASTAQGGLKLELIDTTLIVSGSVTMLEGDFDVNVAGGAHLHLASVGETGPISVGLNSVLAEDLKSATFAASDNVFPLESDQVSALRTANFYANIHTTTVASGEARGQILGELNLFPAESEILFPPDGATLTLEGQDTQAFQPVYHATTDPDQDTVVYVWQLATDANFESIIFAANTGRDSFLLTDFATVDALLEANGVAAGGSITLYHRVLVGDGSNSRPSGGKSVTLTRGQLVNLEEFQPLGFRARAYPSLLRSGQQLTFELATEERFRGRLMLFDQLGQLRQDKTVEASVGLQNVNFATGGLSAGQYFIVLRRDNGRLIHYSKIMVQ